MTTRKNLGARSAVTQRVSIRRGDKDPRAYRNQRKIMQELGTRLGGGLSVGTDGRLAVNKAVRVSPAAVDFNERIVRALIDAGLMEE